MQTTILLPVWLDRGIDMDRFVALLEDGRDISLRVGAEIRVPINGWDAAAQAVSRLRTAGYIVAAHLPPLEHFCHAEGIRWLKEIRPAWVVIHGGTALEGEVNNCNEFIKFLLDRASKLATLATSKVPIFVENTPPREPIRVPDNPGAIVSIRSMIRAGMFVSDLLFLTQKSGCGIVIDTEHMLDTITMIRNKTKINSCFRLTTEEQEFARQFGFVVRDGEMYWIRDCMYNLNLKRQLQLLQPKRFHITGSRVTVSGREITSHLEIKGDPFGNYILRTVFSCQPLSITVESCHKQGKFDFGVIEKSFMFVLKKSNEEESRLAAATRNNTIIDYI